MQEQINTARISEAGRAGLLPYTDTDVNNHEITLPIKKRKPNCMTPEAVFLYLHSTFSAIPLRLSSRHLHHLCFSATQLFWNLFLSE